MSEYDELYGYRHREPPTRMDVDDVRNSIRALRENLDDARTESRFQFLQVEQNIRAILWRVDLMMIIGALAVISTLVRGCT